MLTTSYFAIQSVKQLYGKYAQGREKYLVVDNGLGIIKHKLPIITVDEAQQCHQSNSDLGLDWSKLRKGYLVIPINFR